MYCLSAILSALQKSPRPVIKFSTCYHLLLKFVIIERIDMHLQGGAAGAKKMYDHAVAVKVNAV